MPSDSEKNLSTKKNDTDCWNCVGITYINSELNKEGKKPICYGFEYKASEPIAPDQMESLEKLPVITPNTKMYFIGFTQASTRMHRLGQIPILGVGMTVRMTTSVIHKEPKTSSTREQQTPSAPSDESHETKPSNLPVPSPASSSALQRFSDRWLSSKFLENYWKSCQKLFTGMQRMGTSNLNTLPERVEKSAIKLGQSCQRTAKKLSDKVTDIIFGPSSSSDKPPKS